MKREILHGLKFQIELLGIEWIFAHNYNDRQSHVWIFPVKVPAMQNGQRWIRTNIYPSFFR